MRAVVVDPSVLLPGLFGLKMCRKALVVFAYGCLSYYERLGPDEAALLDEQEAHAAGGPSIRSVVEGAAKKKAHLEEFLPALTPDDLCLVGSSYLFDEIERRARDPYWQRCVPGIGGDLGEIARRQLLRITPIIVPDFELGDVPRYTEGRDRNDDPIVHTAVISGAEIIVSDDADLSTSVEDPTPYTEPASGLYVSAIRFGAFVQNWANSYHFNLWDVEPTALARASALLEP
jgi:predicted nucleic acid-binding protein